MKPHQDGWSALRRGLSIFLTLLLIAAPPINLNAFAEIERHDRPVAMSADCPDHPGKHAGDHRSSALCLQCVVFGGPSVAADFSAWLAGTHRYIQISQRPARDVDFRSVTIALVSCRGPPARA